MVQRNKDAVAPEEGSEEKSACCFVICPIGDPGTEIRRRSDQVLRHIIEPAIQPHGFKALRADQIAEPGMITSQVLQHVIEDSLVIADLTDRNPNVYYELAVRHAIRKPLIQIIKKGESLPFDVAGTRTIHFDHQDLDSVEEAKFEIGRQLQFLRNRPSDIESPISVSLDLQNLRQSDNPEERSLGDILIMMTELRAGMAMIDKRLSDPTSLIPANYIRDVSRSLAGGRENQMMLREIAMMSHRLGEEIEKQKSTTEERKELVEMSRRLRMLCERVI